MNQIILSQIDAFLAIVEAGSFTQAANMLGISKSAVSQSLRALENDLRVNLLIRTTRKILLTEEGELFLQQCQRLKEELGATQDFAKRLNQNPSGALRISCNPYFAQTRLLPLVNQYLRKFPSIHIEILSEERMPDMIKENIDIVFGVNWKPPLDVVAKAIGSTRYIFCASKQYLQVHGMPKKLTDLEQHHYIAHLGRKSTVVNLKEVTQKLSLNCALKMNDTNLMKQCAIDGLGIVELHDYLVQKELANGSLVEVLKNTAHPDIPLYVYYQKNRITQPKVREFVGLIADHIPL